MDSKSDIFSEFPDASVENPGFFATYHERNADQSLRNRSEEVIGPISDAVFARMKPIASTNLEKAVMEYLDDSQTNIEDGTSDFQSHDSTTSAPPKLNSHSVANVNDEKVLNSSNVENTDEIEIFDDTAMLDITKKPLDTEQNVDIPEVPQKSSIDPELWKNGCRYLGSIQASAWCTRQGTSLVKYGERLRIDRLGQSNVVKNKSKDDFNVRFYNSSGLNFARACEEEARFMSVLSDANVCKFEATVIYADTKLRIGSTVIVMVDCYLKMSAFSSMTSFGIDNGHTKKKTVIDETKETPEEKSVRQRQIALVDLFNRLDLIKNQAGLIDDPSKNSSRAASTPAENNFAQSNTQNIAEEDDELDADQLNMFYGNTESARTKLEGESVDPPSTFALELFPYQKRGLAWMLASEREIEHIDEAKSETHPLWTQFKWPEGDPFWANLNSGELSLSRPTLALKSQGGILADDMGLGKTISASALIHSGVNESKDHSTLIVSPMSSLSQWESEVQKATVDSKYCGCFIYYGPTANPSRNLLRDFLSSRKHERKVIITTYGTVKFEHDQRALHKPGTSSFTTTFDRIILDEAQNIKNRTTVAAKACFDLRGHRRWVLTGTPVVNRLEDLYSLVRFIGIEPWNNFRFWKSFITEKFQKPETREIAMKTVQAVVGPICLRRTKAMKDPVTNQPLVSSPEKTVEIKRIPFSKEEQALYSHLFARVRASVQAKVLDGTASTRYVAILKLLTRLRQVCCHPLLLLSNEDENTQSSQNNESTAENSQNRPPSAKRLKTQPTSSGKQEDDSKLDLTSDMNSIIEKFTTESSSIEYTAETLQKLLDKPLELEECSICSEYQSEPVLTECLHSACRDCIITHIDYLTRRGDAAVCHICRNPIDASRLFTVNKTQKCLQPLNHKMQSTKIRALIAALTKSFSQNAGKAVVFSYFTSFLDLIETNLKEAGFPLFRFDGGMSKNKRSSAIEGFINSPHKNAVLLSSQLAGGTGLNLVAAKQAYLMDPWWNYATESQAMDRIHRMGQSKDVNITRFIIEGSIEERMLKIQEHKHALSDLVTSSEERKSETIENLKLLLDLQDENASPNAS